MYLSRHVILKQEIEPYPIMIGACAAHTTKKTTKKVKTPVAVANGGHSSSLWYQRGAFLRRFKIKSQGIHGRLVLRSRILYLPLGPK